MHDVIMMIHTSVHVHMSNQVQVMKEILRQLLHNAEQSKLVNWAIWLEEFFQLLNLDELTRRMICESTKEKFINMIDISKELH